MLNKKKTGPVIMKWKEDEKGKQGKYVLQQSSS
jgi:hypothetical protein